MSCLGPTLIPFHYLIRNNLISTYELIVILSLIGSISDPLLSVLYRLIIGLIHFLSGLSYSSVCWLKIFTCFQNLSEKCFLPYVIPASSGESSQSVVLSRFILVSRQSEVCVRPPTYLFLAVVVFDYSYTASTPTTRDDRPPHLTWVKSFRKQSTNTPTQIWRGNWSSRSGSP